ncbi:Zinc finger BED domain-containing protein 5 [Anthophora retusa]
MSCNIKEQLISKMLKSQYYSLQLDESTDVSNNANLLAFIRYEFEYKIQENLLFCDSRLIRVLQLRPYLIV